MKRKGFPGFLRNIYGIREVFTMQFVCFCIRSVFCYVRQEKRMAFWTFTGMAISSLMVLMCSFYYFEKTKSTQETQFLSNRTTFIMDNFKACAGLIEELSMDDRVNNIQITINMDGVRYGSWIDLGKAFVKERLVSGQYPIDNADDNWCIISFGYQHGQEALGNNIPVIGQKEQISNLWECDIIGVIRDYDYDVLISTKLMINLINEKEDNIQNPSVNITYQYTDDNSETELEEMNYDIISKYRPVNTIRGDFKKGYFFFDFVEEMGSFILLMILSVVNNALIYYCWIQKRFSTYLIYRICGLGLYRMIKLIFCEQLASFTVIHTIVSAGYLLITYICAANSQMTWGINVLIQCVFTGILLLIINAVVFCMSCIMMRHSSLIKIYVKR